MRTVYLDPFSPLLDGTGFIPPDDFNIVPIPDDDDPNDNTALREVILRSIREFRGKHLTESLLLEHWRFDQWSLRDLAEMFGGNPGNLSRKLPRFETMIRQHVIADVAAWLSQRREGFTLSPMTASPILLPNGYAVSIAGCERSVAGVPTRSEWLRYLESNWLTLCEPFAESGSDELRTTYLGGHFCRRSGRTFMDVSVVMSDRDHAMSLGTAEHQQCIYDFYRELVIQL